MNGVRCTNHYSRLSFSGEVPIIPERILAQENNSVVSLSGLDPTRQIDSRMVKVLRVYQSRINERDGLPHKIFAKRRVAQSVE